MPTTPHAGNVLIAHPSADLYGSDRVMFETVEAATGRGRAVHLTVSGPAPLVGEIRHRGATVSFDNSPVLSKGVVRPCGLLRLITRGASGLFAGLRLIHSVQPGVIYMSTLMVPPWVVSEHLLRVLVHESERRAPLVLRQSLAAPLLLARPDRCKQRLLSAGPGRILFHLDRRAQVLYNGVPGPGQPSPGQPSPARPSPARPAIDGPARLLFLGQLLPRKGAQVAVSAVWLRCSCSNHSYPGKTAPTRSNRTFRPRSRSSCTAVLTGRVRPLGFQPDVWPHLANADVLLVPSHGDEPFGNTAFEAVLAGRPVVVSLGSELDEAVRGVSTARRVDPVDAAVWADGVEDLLDDWAATRAQAAVDAVAAGRRFAPGTYRELIADHLDALVDVAVTT